MNALQAVTITAALVFGMTLALLGGLKLALAKRLNLTEARVGRLMAAFNAALVPLTLLAGCLIDTLGVRAVLIVGSLATALAIASLGLKGTDSRSFGSLLLAGLGGSALGASALVLMPHAFFGVDRLASASICVGCVFVALGALVTPVLLDVLYRLMGFRRMSAILAVLCLAPALLAALPDPFADVPTRNVDWANLAGDGNLWLLGLAFLLYAPLEGCVSVWTTTYLTDLGESPGGAAWALSAFWAAFLASRLLTAMLLRWAAAPWGEPWLPAAAAVCAAAVVGNMVGTANRSSARFSLVLLGFLLGPIIPMLVSLAFRAEPTAPGTAYGVLFAAGSVGGLVMAPLVGALAERSDVQAALRVPMVLAVALSAAALVFALTR